MGVAKRKRKGMDDAQAVDNLGDSGLRAGSVLHS
jgi:hypothetical protein